MEKSYCQLIYVKTYFDDPQTFYLCIDVTLGEKYWKKLCKTLIALISHDDYCSQFYHPFSELVQ
jgi:hypothetical protein